MSTAAPRSLQVEERPRAPIKTPFKATIRSNGNGHARANGNGHASSNGNAAACHAARPCVFVAAENRLLREALSRMLRKNGDVEVLVSETADLLPKPLQSGAQRTLENDADRQFSDPETRILAGILDAEILLLSSKGNLE